MLQGGGYEKCKSCRFAMAYQQLIFISQRSSTSFGTWL